MSQLAGARFESDGHGGVTVWLDGQPQSYVVLSDPLLLVFEYVQLLGLLLDVLPTGRLAVTHVGGAGLTVPRYVQATRPGSPQLVLEPAAALTEAVRRELPLPRGHRIRVRAVDGLAGVAGLRDESADVVVIDAYDDGRMPASLVTVPFLADVGRVLRDGGMVLLNLADEPGLRYAAKVLATLQAAGCFADVVLLAPQEVVKGRRFGNVVVGARRGAPLDLAAITRKAASAPTPTAVRHGAALLRMMAGERPFTLKDAVPSPAPPDPGAWRAR